MICFFEGSQSRKLPKSFQLLKKATELFAQSVVGDFATCLLHCQLPLIEKRH